MSTSTTPRHGPTREEPDRNLAMELVRVTEAAAMAAGRWVGRGDKNGGDQAAVDAMRKLVGSVSMRGVVVIGEGEKDEAPMLFNGEEVGNGQGPECDVAVDPIDGTTLMSRGMPNALAVLAVSERGTMFDPSAVFYMEKIATGPEAAEVIDLSAPVVDNIKRVAKAKRMGISDITVCILDRPRHNDLVRQVREAGARITFITDGDVAGAIAAARPDTGVDLLVGIGGTPEGIISAAALRCMGGAIQGRLWPRDDTERQAALDAGHDLERILTTEDLVCGDNVFFCATGITDGELLRGVTYHEGGCRTHSIVMRSKSGTVRMIDSVHRLTKLRQYAAVDFDQLPALMTQHYRVERDTMGEVQVPADALYRAQTQRAVDNFPISGRGLERSQIRALGLVKAACARVNAQLGVLDPTLAQAVASAAQQVAAGEHDAQFPVDVFQTGSGTSSNMNANEVIATLASRIAGCEVHPNDHVNASQSSNDVFPTTIHLAATEALARDVMPALAHLESALTRRSHDWAEVVKAGRTHLMDAVPVTLGQEAGGWAAQARHGVERLASCLPRLGELPIGGTAVGTGLNAPAGFGAAVVEQLRAATGLEVLTEARDHIEAQAARDGLVECSGALRTVAVSLFKIANDIRWLGSGPRTGLAELRLPDLQPGSSIMPGKVNPVICEATMMVAAQVIGNDACVAFSGSQGNLELNVMMPVMARNVLESARLLAAAARLLADKVIKDAEADVQRCREYAESSPAIVTSLNRYLGYEEAASIAKQALLQRRAIRDVVGERGHLENGTLTPDQLDKVLDVLDMALSPRSGDKPR